MLLPQIPVTLAEIEDSAARYSGATSSNHAGQAAAAVADLTRRAALSQHVHDLIDAIADRRDSGTPADELLDQVADALTRLAAGTAEPAPGDAVIIPSWPGGEVWTVETIREHGDDGHRYLALTRRGRHGRGQIGTSIGIDRVRVVRRAANRRDLHQQAPHLSLYETHRVPVDDRYTVEDLRAIASRVGGIHRAGKMNKNELIRALNGRLLNRRD